MTFRRLTASLVVGALAFALSGCGEDEPEPRAGVRIEDLTGDASGNFDLDEAEAGERISLRVEVAEVLSPDSFVVPSKDTAGPPLLVLAQEHGASAGDVLQIGGLTRVFSYDELARGYELTKAEAYRAYDGELAMIASLVDEDLPMDDK